MTDQESGRERNGPGKRRTNSEKENITRGKWRPRIEDTSRT